MHGACMATKTISIDLEAYEALCRARIEPKESFSRVIRRARWGKSSCTGQALLDAMSQLPPLSVSEIDALEMVHAADVPPRDKWE